MSIDERIERLTERHEALTQSVELLHRDIQQMHRQFETGHKDIELLKNLAQQDGENIRALARIADPANSSRRRFGRMRGRGRHKTG